MAEPLLLTDPHRAKSDARMIERAIRNGWKIPEQVMEALPNHLTRLALTSTDDRTKLAAAKVLVAMHGQNQANEPKAVKQVEHHHQIELGPITEANLEEHRQRLAQRIAGLGKNA